MGIGRKTPESFGGIHPFEYLLRRTLPLVQESRYITRELHKTAFVGGLMYEGKHRFFYNPQRDWFYENPTENVVTSLYHADNYFRFLTRSNTKEYLKSQPSIRARAANVDEADAQDAVLYYEAVKSDFERRKRPSAVRRVEYNRVQIMGNCAVHIDFCRGDGARTRLPIHEQIEHKPAPDSLTCYGCGTEMEGEIPPGTDDSSPIPCPQCGSTETEAVRVPTIPKVVQVGEIEVPVGDWKVDSVSVLQLSVNATARDHVELSDVFWLRNQYIQPRSVGEALYPGYNLPSGTTAIGDEGNRGLRYQELLAEAIGGTNNPDWLPLSPWPDRLTCVEDWFTPVAYKEYVVAPGDSWEIEIDTDEGPQPVTMTEGMRLSDVLPFGCKFIHYGYVPVKLCAKGNQKRTAIQQHWQWYGFDPKIESFFYSGTEDAIPLQLELNEYNSFLKTLGKTTGMPLTAVRKAFVEDIGLASNPAKILCVNDDAGEMPMRDIIETWPPHEAAQGIYEFRNSIKESMRLATGALDELTGSAVGGERTATQSSILQASALAHAEAVIDGLQEAEARLDTLACELYKQNAKIPKVFEVKSDYGDTEMKAFSGQELGVDVIFVVEPGSSLPRRPYQQRDDFEGFLAQKAKMLEAGSPLDPDMEAAAANTYGLSFLTVKAKRAERRTKLEIDALLQIVGQKDAILGQMLATKIQQMQVQLAGQAQMMGAPPQMAIQAIQSAEQMLTEQAQTPEGQAALILEFVASDPTVPPVAKIDMAADDHDGIISFLRRFLNNERGLELDVLSRAVLSARIVERFSARGEAGALVTASDVTAQAPAMMAMAQQQAAQQASQEPDADEQNSSPGKPKGAPGDTDRARREGERDHPRKRRPERPADA